MWVRFLERNWSEKFVVLSGCSVSLHEIIHRNRGLPQEQISKEGPKMGFPTLRESLGRAGGAAQLFSQMFSLPSQTSHEMMMQCVSRVVSHPLHGESCPLAGSPFQRGITPNPAYSEG